MPSVRTPALAATLTTALLFGPAIVLAAAPVAAPKSEAPASKPAAGAGARPAKGAEKPEDAPPLSLRATPEDYVEHKTEDGSASLRSPASWTSKPAQTGNVKINLIADAAAGSSVNLVVVKLPVDVALGQVKDIMLAGVKSSFKDVTVESADYVKVAGQAALRVVYAAALPGQNVKLKFCQVVTLKGRTQYVLTYTAREAGFDAELPTAEQVMASFAIK